ncbi:hypothetical protein LIER_39227 [Lithospermum erythrorhizon]|uniref:Pentatricopeptide repeat-containing protein n=1 Tax=Lithospermum erythrorhizon TaxID=34254 RepID=A0AAV3QDX4_LITER
MLTNLSRINLLLRSFCSHSDAIKNATSPEKALKLYAQLHRQCSPIDSYTILFTLKASTFMKDLPIINHLHAHIHKMGYGSHVYVATALLGGYVTTSLRDAIQLFDEMPSRNIVTWNTLINGFLRAGDVETGRRLFEEMPDRDSVSWSTMIAWHMSNGYEVKGLALFKEMTLPQRLKPDQITLGAVLMGCARMGSMGILVGKLFHGFVIKNHWKLNVEFGTCLVDMYAKVGCLRNACLVFDMMEVKNVVTWTALICGAAQHGFGKEALLLFDRMVESGVNPNELTFTGILSACAQAGLLEEGRKHFNMIEAYCLRPRIQHYGCMVDLLGKAGLVVEAFEVIKTMPMEPNVVIWGSFLLSCKLHKQFDLAERFIERIMSVVTPENDGGVYSLVADLYVLNGRWHDAERVRKLMLNQNVRKTRGSSHLNSGMI